ncbi:hypothetical protein K439DRAFT_1619942 [Ramaria rubella]|nr:hypothetical protein K439DRAFT_1619942 [Ramaria rubella]
MVELEDKKYSTYIMVIFCGSSGKFLEDRWEDLTPMQRNSHITHMDPIELSDRFDIFHMQKPSVMVFTHKATGDIATFKLRRYIVGKELPPIYANTKLPHEPLWASQFVTICGLNLDPFTNGLKIVMALYQAFATRVGEDNVQKFSVAQFAGYP